MTKEIRNSWLYRRRWILLVSACVIAAAAYLIFRKSKPAVGGPEGRRISAGVPVSAEPVKKGNLNVYISGLGTVTSRNTVTVKTRIDGQLMKVFFREGQVVNEGSLLASIDPRPFQVQLAQAEGQLARDRALLNNARVDLDRYRVLWKQDSISQQQLATQESLVRQYEGIVKSDKGQVDNARLQLLYCRITAPISGRTGLRLVDPGNIVHASDPNGLVVITQIRPMTVIFPIPEENLRQVLAGFRAHRRLPVEALDRSMKHSLAKGYLLTIDNQIDPATGTVRLRAIFPNRDGMLFPNQFVNARLLVDVVRGAVIVPAPAVQRGPQGVFVYVVKQDMTVSVRKITAGETQGGGTTVKSGLVPGELVVVDGFDRLREGAAVVLKGKTSGVSQKPPSTEKKPRTKKGRPVKNRKVNTTR
jgi:multidrug efflux system membrane fusion protein